MCFLLSVPHNKLQNESLATGKPGRMAPQEIYFHKSLYLTAQQGAIGMKDCAILPLVKFRRNFTQ